MTDMMSIRFGNVRISVIFVFLALMFIAVNFSVYTLIVFACIAIHEAGHIVFIKSRGLQILSVEIMPWGINMTTGGLASYKSDILIALGGPAFNIIAALGIFALMRVGAAGGNAALTFAFLMNIIYAAVNLFPVAGLDGGRALACMLKLRLPEDMARRVFAVISAVALAVLSACAFLILTLTGYNFSLVLLCGYLFYTIYFRPTAVRQQ